MDLRKELKRKCFGKISPNLPAVSFPPTQGSLCGSVKLDKSFSLKFQTKISYIKPSKIAKKLFLSRHLIEMSLQFSVDELIQPLVSLSYLSSDDEMEVDCPSSQTEADPDVDSDKELIACYREAPVPIPRGMGGRGMTLDLSNCLDNDSQSSTLCSQGSYFNSEPDNELIDLVLGLHPPSRGSTNVSGQMMANCSQLEPALESPQSPPPHERGYQTIPEAPRWDQDERYWPPNSHITGVTVRTSGHCGVQNLVQYGDCVVCGKAADINQEEVIFNYLERTHQAGESYETRQRRRHAFQAGMQAGAFVLVPRGRSQTAAFDGNNYQIAPNKCDDLPSLPGVLPL